MPSGQCTILVVLKKTRPATGAASPAIRGRRGVTRQARGPGVAGAPRLVSKSPPGGGGARPASRSPSRPRCLHHKITGEPAAARSERPACASSASGSSATAVSPRHASEGGGQVRPSRDLTTRPSSPPAPPPPRTAPRAGPPPQHRQQLARLAARAPYMPTAARPSLQSPPNAPASASRSPVAAAASARSAASAASTAARAARRRRRPGRDPGRPPPGAAPGICARRRRGSPPAGHHRRPRTPRGTGRPPPTRPARPGRARAAGPVPCTPAAGARPGGPRRAAPGPVNGTAPVGGQRPQDLGGRVQVYRAAERAGDGPPGRPW